MMRRKYMEEKLAQKEAFKKYTCPTELRFSLAPGASSSSLF